MKKSILVLLPVIMLLAPGCILLDHENPDCIGSNCHEYPGDIRFYWAFELADGTTTDWCNVAEVARIDVVIYDDDGTTPLFTVTKSDTGRTVVIH